jgi:hypothetical protein
MLNAINYNCRKTVRRDGLVFCYARLSLAHLARCAAAIFLLTAALMVRFFPDAALLDEDPSSRLRSSLFSLSSFSLIDAARLKTVEICGSLRREKSGREAS